MLTLFLLLQALCMVFFQGLDKFFNKSQTVSSRPGRSHSIATDQKPLSLSGIFSVGAISTDCLWSDCFWSRKAKTRSAHPSISYRSAICWGHFFSPQFQPFY